MQIRGLHVRAKRDLSGGCVVVRVTQQVEQNLPQAVGIHLDERKLFWYAEPPGDTLRMGQRLDHVLEDGMQQRARIDDLRIEIEFVDLSA